MPSVGVGEVTCPHKERLQSLLGTGDDGGVIAEQQTSQYSNKDDGEKISAVAIHSLFHD